MDGMVMWSQCSAEMLKPRGQTDLEAKIVVSALGLGLVTSGLGLAALGPFNLGLKLLDSASKFNSISLWNLVSLAFRNQNML